MKIGKDNFFYVILFWIVQKMKFSAETVDLATFTEEILNGELHSFCSVKYGELHNSLQHSLDYKFRKTVDQF